MFKFSCTYGPAIKHVVCVKMPLSHLFLSVLEDSVVPETKLLPVPKLMYKSSFSPWRELLWFTNPGTYYIVGWLLCALNFGGESFPVENGSHFMY